ncbi:MAG: hypothetical protein KKF50_03570 [Nanoarchaeota archaeon]|nr:hypothetical protein [Nanoarchaeota archaeon]
MKGDAILFLLFLGLFSISLVSAGPEITFQYNETQPGETIFATISIPGELTKEILESDITFLEGRKKVFFEFDLTYFNGTYYFYTYTTREGNFTLEISDILYKEDGNLQAAILKKDFQVQEELIIEENVTRTEILSIKPGFIKFSNELNITFTNKGNSSFNVTCQDQEISLEPLASEKISFEQESQFEFLSCLAYKEFLIPVIRTKPGEIIVLPVSHNLKTNPESISLNITLGEPIEKQLQLFNFGDDNFTDFEIASDFDFIELENLETLEGREIKNLSLTIAPKLPGHFEGTINISYLHNNETKTLFLPLDFFILPAGSEISDFAISNLSCAELGGSVCSSGIQLCNGTIEFTDIGEYCCKGNCIAKPSQKKEGGEGYGWLIALLIFAALGAGGYYLYKRQKKIGPQKPEDQLKQTSEKFEKRMKGTFEPKRVSGNLERS